MLSPLKQIPIQLLLYKRTTFLRRPATTFFLSLKWKKTCLKNPYKTLPNKWMANIHQAKIHKNKFLSDYIYSIALYNAKFNVYKIWTVYKIIWNYVKSCKIFFLYKKEMRFLENAIKHLWWGFFVKKSNSKNLLTIFAKKLHHRLVEALGNTVKQNGYFC